MRCTRCNQKVNPVVAIDIDGTLGNYHSHFLNFAAGYLGKDISPTRDYIDVWNDYDGSVPFKSWFCKTYGVTEQMWHDIKLTYRQGAQKRTMPIYHGAHELVASLTSLGAEIWLTTTRPFQRLDNIDPDTREWLNRHNIPYFGLLYDEKKYKKLHEIVGEHRVCAVLDDLKPELQEAGAEFGHKTTILRRTEWNRGVFHRYSVSSLVDAQILISNRIETWYVQYGRPIQSDGERHHSGPSRAASS